ncbi:MAG: nicotinamide-nucleotide adenylyltransferase [Candidatus Bathyarchaeia archaeon]
MPRGKKLGVGLYIGRFQPPHKGHVHAIKHALGMVKELLVGIGSAQYSHEFNNPFTVGERFTMLRLALDSSGIDRRRYTILPVPDTDVHSIWVAQIRANMPKFEIIFTNEPLTRRLLEEDGFQVKGIPFFDRKKWNATSVRDRILKNESWIQFVPRQVAHYIKQIGGVQRIRELSGTDKAEEPHGL